MASLVDELLGDTAIDDDFSLLAADGGVGSSPLADLVAKRIGVRVGPPASGTSAGGGPDVLVGGAESDGAGVDVGTSPVDVNAAVREALEALEGAGTVETAVPGGGPAVTEPVRRPNGDVYLPRAVAGTTDLALLRSLREATPSIPVLLAGPPGTGKTAAAEAHAVNCGVGCYTVNGHADTEVADLVGRYVPQPGGGYRWVDGPLVKAMREGAILFLDDVTLISPGVLSRIYPVLDGRGRIFVEEHEGEEVVAAAGFHCVGAHNPGVTGAVLVSPLASRFTVQIEVFTDYQLAIDLGVQRPAVKVAQAMADRRDAGEGMWAPELLQLAAVRQGRHRRHLHVLPDPRRGRPGRTESPSA